MEPVALHVLASNAVQAGVHFPFVQQELLRLGVASEELVALLQSCDPAELHATLMELTCAEPQAQSSGGNGSMGTDNQLPQNHLASMLGAILGGKGFGKGAGKSAGKGFGMPSERGPYSAGSDPNPLSVLPGLLGAFLGGKGKGKGAAAPAAAAGEAQQASADMNRSAFDQSAKDLVEMGLVSDISAARSLLTQYGDISSVVEALSTD
eukprot:TRINITY_DN13000_c0_g1_i2.p1 TRINITY_DN13000_c0_g1~~TRINITY_DN13000_c0_g1_i2.p1  ORF type:complete len:208 (-),score=47.96 TRINITY_DN13000_c0_g1_i2:78-701(-)